MCEVKEDGGRRDGEDSIISARLVQFVTPAVVFNQPPRAACTANSLIISRSLSLSPACLLSLLAGQLQQMGAVSHDPQPPPDPPTRGTSLNTHKSNAHTVYMLSSLLYRPPTSHVSHILQQQVATNLKNYFLKEFLLLFQSSWSEIKTKKQKLKRFLFHFYPKNRSKYI